MNDTTNIEMLLRIVDKWGDELLLERRIPTGELYISINTADGTPEKTVELSAGELSVLIEVLREAQ